MSVFHLDLLSICKLRVPRFSRAASWKGKLIIYDNLTDLIKQILMNRRDQSAVRIHSRCRNEIVYLSEQHLHGVCHRFGSHKLDRCLNECAIFLASDGRTDFLRITPLPGFLCKPRVGVGVDWLLDLSRRLFPPTTMLSIDLF